MQILKHNIHQLIWDVNDNGYPQHQLHIAAKYNDLKDVILNNEICTLTLNEYYPFISVISALTLQVYEQQITHT